MSGRLMMWSFAAVACLAAAPEAASAQGKERDEIAVKEAFLNQERDVWELESRLLKEAMDSIVADRQVQKTELGLRKVIRTGRSSQTLRKVRTFVDEHLDPETRSLLKDIGSANDGSAEDVFADYLTLEATVDFSLMASAYNTVNGNNFDKFPADSRRLLNNLTANLRKAPVPANDIEVGKIRGDRLMVSVFGCDVVEEVARVDFERRSALLTWRSNYSFLRDLKDRKDPKEDREERMTYEANRWTISYKQELEEFVDGPGRTEWARKVKELVNIDSYLSKKDPLDETKSRRTRYNYDPENADDSTSRFTGDRRPEDRRDDRRDDRRNDRRDDR